MGGSKTTSGARARKTEAVPSPSLADVLQVERLFDFVPPSAAVELAATCWDGLVAVLRYGCGYEGVADWWAHDDYDRWSDQSKHRVAVRRILPGGALVRGLAARMEGVSRCVGRLEVAGAHFPAEDARAVSEAADAAGVVGSETDGPDEQIAALAGMVRAGGARLRVVKVCVSDKDAPGALDWSSKDGIFNVDLFLDVLEAPAVRDHLETFSVTNVVAVGAEVEGMLAALCDASALRVLQLRGAGTAGSSSHILSTDFSRVLSRLVRGCGTLEVLELLELELNCDDAEQLVDAVRARSTTLRKLRFGPFGDLGFDFARELSKSSLNGTPELDLAFSSIGEKDVEDVAEMLATSATDNLAALHLEHTDILVRDDGPLRCDQLEKLLRACSVLRKLTLRHTSAEVWSAIQRAAKGPLPLEVLHAEEDEVDDEAAEVVAEVLAASTTLREVRIRYMIKDYDEEDHFVHLPGRRQDVVRKLAAAVRDSRSLRTLDVDYNHRDAAALARALVQNTSVRNLILERRDGSQADYTAPKVFHTLLTRNATLEVLKIEVAHSSMLEQLVKGLKDNTSLRVLEISGSFYSEMPREQSPQVAGLAFALHKNDTLKVLGLDLERLEPYALTAMGGVLARNQGLEVLRVGAPDADLDFNDEVATTFARGLSSNCTLCELQLAGKFTAVGLRALRDALADRAGAFRLALTLQPADAPPDLIEEVRSACAHVTINIEDSA
ncbi:unnamed protein product [Pedinophyceae sp. YPF-701]|nr:unnamed protein product [Pedinophyceae sp. YPF-701]